MVRVLPGLCQSVFGEKPGGASDGHAAVTGDAGTGGGWRRPVSPGAPTQHHLHDHGVSVFQHPFIKTSKPRSVLRTLISDAMEIKLKRQQEAEQREQDGEDEENSVRRERLQGGGEDLHRVLRPLNACVLQDEDEVDQGTMVRAGTADSGTIRPADSLAGTMIHHEDTDTLLGTLVINSDEEDAGTMKRKVL